jgi:hypothetical protein
LPATFSFFFFTRLQSLLQIDLSPFQQLFAMRGKFNEIAAGQRPAARGGWAAFACCQQQQEEDGCWLAFLFPFPRLLLGRGRVFTLCSHRPNGR